MICLICDVQVQMAFLKRSPSTTRIFVGLFHPDISQNYCLPQFSLFPVSPKGSIEQPTVISLDINDQTSFCNCWKPGYRKFSLSGYFCLSNSCANKVYEWFGLSITLKNKCQGVTAISFALCRSARELNRVHYNFGFRNFEERDSNYKLCIKSQKLFVRSSLQKMNAWCSQCY